MSDIVKYDDYLRTGIDPNPYLTQPLDEIMHSSDWAPDSSDDVCQMCYCKFTLFNRRHHCRCCGQLYCAKCCPPSDDIRLCVLCCFSFISADPENQPKTMEDFCKFDAVNEILAADSNEILLEQVVLIIGNYMRNDNARKLTLKHFPKVFSTAYFQITHSLNVRAAIGLFINFTQTQLDFDFDFNFELEVAKKLPGESLTDLARLWVNLSSTKAWAEKFAANEEIDKIVWFLYKEVGMAGKLSVLNIITNLIRVDQDMTKLVDEQIQEDLEAYIADPDQLTANTAIRLLSELIHVEEFHHLFAKTLFKQIVLNYKKDNQGLTKLATIHFFNEVIKSDFQEYCFQKQVTFLAVEDETLLDAMIKTDPELLNELVVENELVEQAVDMITEMEEYKTLRKLLKGTELGDALRK
ncbi:FYVE_zinc finger domain-containing protein [Hexamita inflata]|uniref:FYVE zinc finger domain-containing protein n=1 Tax=Hexamita inflata TaxID=28002 RepID=A0AA86V6E7_9EUKA|nr:FYVE zinc finger domain-containing protein [Hexamita inflata]